MAAGHSRSPPGRVLTRSVTQGEAMHKKVLIAGFACLSVIAVAQSSGTKDQTASTTKGKLTSAQPAITDNKKTASATEQNGSGQTRVATGDLDGDGRPDVTAAASANKPAGSKAGLSHPAASGQVKAPQQRATGQAS